MSPSKTNTTNLLKSEQDIDDDDDFLAPIPKTPLNKLLFNGASNITEKTGYTPQKISTPGFTPLSKNKKKNFKKNESLSPKKQLFFSPQQIAAITFADDDIEELNKDFKEKGSTEIKKEKELTKPPKYITALREIVEVSERFSSSVEELMRRTKEVKIQQEKLGLSEEIKELFTLADDFYQPLTTNIFASLGNPENISKENFFEKLEQFEKILNSDEFIEHIAYITQIASSFNEINLILMNPDNKKLLNDDTKYTEALNFYFIMPIQHIARYPLLLQALIKEYDDQFTEEEQQVDLSKLLSRTQTLCAFVNSRVGYKKNNISFLNWRSYLTKQPRFFDNAAAHRNITKTLSDTLYPVHESPLKSPGGNWDWLSDVKV